MAGATAAGAAGAAATADAGTVQITQSNNFVNYTTNQLNADFTGDMNPDGILSGFGGFTSSSYVTFFSSKRFQYYTRIASASLNSSRIGAAQVRTVYSYSYPVGGFLGSSFRNYFAFVRGTVSTYSFGSSPASAAGLVPIFFQDARINGGSNTGGFLDVSAFSTGFTNHTVQILRLVFDDASTTAPTGVTAGGSNTEWTSPVAEIDIRGNGVSIASGDATPSLGDNTDFGSSTVGSAVLKSFQIFNTGSATLTVSGTGLSSPDFSVSAASGAIAPGNSLSFNVTFNPSSAGTKIANVTVNSDDSDEAAYSFAVTGIGVAPTVAPPVVADPNAALKASLNNKIKKLKKKVKVSKAKGKKAKAKKLQKKIKKLSNFFRSL